MKPFLIRVHNEAVTIAIWAHDANHAQSLFSTCLQRHCEVVGVIDRVEEVVPIQLQPGEVPPERAAMRDSVASANLPALADAPLPRPYEDNKGQTHWDGCFTTKGHHNCAIDRINELEKAR